MIHRFEIGDAKIVELYDSTLHLPPSAVFPSVTEEQWREAAPAVAQEGMLHLNLAAFLVRLNGKTILVDAGIGPEGNAAFGIAPGQLLDSMREAGASPEEIDIVAITHLHIDHAGWATVERNGRPTPTFSRARYLVQRAEYDYARSEAGQAAGSTTNMEKSIEPLAGAGQLDLIDGEQMISQGLTFVSTPGHTPAHASIAISASGQRGMIMGDVTHHPVQILHPDWNPGFDADPEQSARTRKRIFDQIEAESLLIAAGHYPPPGFGRVVIRNGRRSWEPAPTTSA